MEKVIKKSIKINETELSLEVGRVAGQANGAVMVRMGDTVVLVTVTSGGVKEGLDYFPMTVDYVERLYAGGRIKGSRWVKREGRPSDEAILTGRLVDRCLRPLFPDGYRNEVQVVVTELSVDGENDLKLLGVVGASAALAISDILWEGPVGAVRVGMKDGTFFINPTETELGFSDLDLVMATTKDAIIMIESEAKEVSEDRLLAAVRFGQQEAGKVIGLIEELVAAVGKKKETVELALPGSGLLDKADKEYGERLDEVIKKDEAEMREELAAIKAEMAASGDEEMKQKGGLALEKLFKKHYRKLLLSGKRADGRGYEEIRPISCEVGVLPRAHGSAIFTRGMTQALTVTTLGSPAMEQLIETAEGEESKRYIHHYSMPPYASGEAGRIGSPSRREIGHGALAERAMMPVIPNEDRFPYTIRVVSEIMSSNGSTSMASVCGSTLSLMDAGVPIVRPVSGIAMGLVMGEKGKFVVLSDIAGQEDFNGDMDFKVAGTSEGVTALQLDVKTRFLTSEILETALGQVKRGKGEILEKMLAVLPESRGKVSTFAPKVEIVKVDTEKIGEIIGPGGKMIRRLIAETGATIDVEDDGTVSICGVSEEGVAMAKARVEGLVKEVQPGEVYKGVVKRIQPFGAFVEILPGKEGLVHVSDMQEGFTQDPRDVVGEGQEVEVKVKEIDNMRRINLTMVMEQREGGERREERRQKRSRPPFASGGRGSKFNPRRRF